MPMLKIWIYVRTYTCIILRVFVCLSTLAFGRPRCPRQKSGLAYRPRNCQRSCTMMLLLPLALLLATAASASGANAPHLFMFIVDDLGCANACLSAGHRSSSSGRTVVTAAR